jgi:hypothetical protein
MKLYNIRLPDELSYALKQAGADHVRQTLASSYGIDCKTTKDKPIPPERKTTKERKTKEVVVEECKTTEPVGKVVEEQAPEDYLIPGVASWVEPPPEPVVEFAPETMPTASDDLWEEPKHSLPKYKVFDPKNPVGSRPNFNTENVKYLIWQKEKKEHADSLRVNLTGARQS